MKRSSARLRCFLHRGAGRLSGEAEALGRRRDRSARARARQSSPVKLSKRIDRKVTFSFATEDREACRRLRLRRDRRGARRSRRASARRRSACRSATTRPTNSTRSSSLRLLSAKRAKIAGGAAERDDRRRRLSARDCPCSTESIPEGPADSISAPLIEVSLSAVEREADRVLLGDLRRDGDRGRGLSGIGQHHRDSRRDREPMTFFVFVLDDTTWTNSTRRFKVQLTGGGDATLVGADPVGNDHRRRPGADCLTVDDRRRRGHRGHLRAHGRGSAQRRQREDDRGRLRDRERHRHRARLTSRRRPAISPSPLATPRRAST